MASTVKSSEQMALYERSLEGDTEAFWELIRPSERLIFSAALGVMRDPERAQDVVHDVYVRAFSTLGNLRSPTKLNWWLYSMGRNVAHEHLRRQGRQERIKGDPRSHPEVISVSEMMIAEEELRMLTEAMDGLPEAHREVLTLKYMNHFSCKEIAETLDIGVEAAKSRLFEARKLLRKRMMAAEKPAANSPAASRGVQNGGGN